MADKNEDIKRKLNQLSERRARNSVIAFRRQNDPGIHEGRVRADKVWGQQQQELAKSLPEGDETRKVMETIGWLDAISPPPHLVSKSPQDTEAKLGDIWPEPKKK